jgi:hypothetical protein
MAGTLVLCAFLGFTGVSLFLIALRQIFQGLSGADFPFPVVIDPQVLRFTAIMVILNVALGIYASYQARTLNSLALKLNAQHFLADAWLSILMVMVLLAIWQNQVWLDPTFALVLLPLVARSLWRVLNEQLPMLLRPTAIAPKQSPTWVTRWRASPTASAFDREGWSVARFGLNSTWPSTPSLWKPPIALENRSMPCCANSMAPCVPRSGLSPPAPGKMLTWALGPRNIYRRRRGDGGN